MDTETMKRLRAELTAAFDADWADNPDSMNTVYPRTEALEAAIGMETLRVLREAEEAERMAA